jgi:hypothetical protein
MFRKNRLSAVPDCRVLLTGATAALRADRLLRRVVGDAIARQHREPAVGDFVGLPFNAAGMLRGESWDPALLSLPEYQCRPHGWAYIYRGPTQLRISKEIDESTRDLVAYQPEWHQSTNSPSIWTAGRVRPKRLRTPGAATPRARGRATSSASRPRT